MSHTTAIVHRMRFGLGLRVLLSLLFILFQTGTHGVEGSSSHHPSRKIFCRFSSKEYSPGDVWYPTTREPIGDRCVRCTCLPTGKLNCTTEACPSYCSSSSEQACCQACTLNPDSTPATGGDRFPFQPDPDSTPAGLLTQSPESRESNRLRQISRLQEQIQSASFGSGLESSSSNEELDDEDEDPDNSPCRHQGRTYKDGETFTANVTGLPIASVDQCMQCKCENGMVLCAMKSCSSFKCGPVDFGGDGAGGDTCCQRCAVWRGSKNYKPDLGRQRPILQKPTQPPATPNSNQQRTSAFFGNGGSGNGNGGLLESMTLESSVSFRDVTSINNVVGNGKESRKPVDDCISSGRFYLHGSTWHPIIGPFGTMECVSCKCNHGQIECNRLKCPARRELTCSKPIKVEGHCCPICGSPVDSTVDEGSTMCVSGKQDFTVFKSLGTGLNGTELIEFAFLRPRKLIGSPESQIERHEWRLREANIEFTTEDMSTNQFESLGNRKSFVLLGATNKKNVDKFTSREKKLEERCTSRCSVRISSLERSLRLHKLISRTQCLSHERVVPTL